MLLIRILQVTYDVGMLAWVEVQILDQTLVQTQIKAVHVRLLSLLHDYTLLLAWLVLSSVHFIMGVTLVMLADLIYFP